MSGCLAPQALRKGDVLSICQPQLAGCPTPAPDREPAPAPEAMIPDYPQQWEIKVLYGPHGAPDFFTEEAIEQFFEADWQVHYNSNRLGIRLVGPKPSWARTDGGEAGLHLWLRHRAQSGNAAHRRHVEGERRGGERAQEHDCR